MKPKTTHLDTYGVKMAQSAAAELRHRPAATFLGGGSARLHSFRIPLFLPNDHTHAAADKPQEQRLV